MHAVGHLGFVALKMWESPVPLCFRKGSLEIPTWSAGHEVLSFLMWSSFLVMQSWVGPFWQVLSATMDAFSLIAEACVMSRE